MIASGKMLAFRYGDPAPSSKLAVFDFDGTLANPLGCMGDRCPDYVWDGYREWTNTFATELRPVMRGLIGDGYKIIIVSNQGPLRFASPERPELVGRDVRGHLPAEKEASWVSKLIEFCQLLNAGADPAAPVEVPVHVFGLMGATETGFYKPCADWWALYADDFNGDIREIDCEASFFVGDAGGRLRGDTTNPWQDGRDYWEGLGWAASDRQFAFSGGVKYKTPEQLFLGSPAPAPDDYHQESFEREWCGRRTDKKWCSRARRSVSAAQIQRP